MAAMDTPQSTAELARLLHNLIRLGTITHVDHARRLVRVQTGGLHTNWLKWHTARAGTSRVWDPPTAGEHVILFAPGGDLAAAVVLASLDSQQNPPPSSSPDDVVRTMPDGARFSYNHATGALSITGIQTLRIDAQDSITLRAGNLVHIDTPRTTMTGGDVTHTGGALSSNGVVLDQHVHTGVVPGGANTGEPV